MTQPDPGRESQLGKWLKLTLGIGISVAMIWYAFRDTPFGDVWNLITGMRVVPMIFAVVLATLPFALRVPRWSFLLRREDGSALPTKSLWHSVAIGFAANNILPFRLGEVARMGAISRLERVPFTSAFASVAVERVIDALTVITLFALGLLVTDLTASGDATNKAQLGALIATVALVGAMVVARWPALATTPVAAVIPEGKVRKVLLGIIDRLVAGLSALSDPSRALRVVGWSVVVWITNAAAFWVAFAAFGIDIPFSGALILQGMLSVGIAIPSSPGYAGVFELTIMLTLTSLFGVAEDVALAYAITYHVTTFIPITILGVISLMSTGLTVSSATEAVK